MKTFQLKTIALVLFVTTLFSCSNSDNDLGIETPEVVKPALVSNVTGPATARANKQVKIVVEFKVESNCGSLNRFITTTEDVDVARVEVEARYSGQCSPQIITRTVDYVFAAPAVGTYKIRFKSGPSEFITHTMEITQ
ncbi:hypothetical protein [Flavobacterium sp. '19STA2R22 D10 B1']|uniref:hypothetical protein n=1 Tax=Flavobacterium aerium TaxID=3037261 RepID=UPI00278C4119|nr:hypothetical protein [Flavobacterium sp. '19STA2R22 D10 B1']